MKPKSAVVAMRILGTLLSLAGVVLAWSVNWKIGLALFLFGAGNNLEQQMRKDSPWPKP